MLLESCIKDSLSSGKTLLFSHGFNVHYNLIDIPDNIPEVLGQSFYLQIGAYKEYSNARKVRDVLNLKGFNARIKHISLDGARLYSVLEGRYPSFDLAKKSSKQIEKKLNYSSIIKQHN